MGAAVGVGGTSVAVGRNVEVGRGTIVLVAGGTTGVGVSAIAPPPQAKTNTATITTNIASLNGRFLFIHSPLAETSANFLITYYATNNK
jgi:hypothetical protein